MCTPPSFTFLADFITIIHPLATNSNIATFKFKGFLSFHSRWISHYIPTFTEFTHAYIKNNSTEFDWDLFISRYEVTFVGGKFFEIEKTEQAYAGLIEQMHQEKWVFNHMSVTSDANKYVVFFA